MCNATKKHQVKFKRHLPPLLSIELLNQAAIITQKITLTSEFESSVYKLRGIIYSGGFHFTARVIDSESNVWYYDGVTTKREPQYEGLLSNVGDLHTAVTRNACILIYSP
ncbi:hypothetical protein DENSPDRAFT_789689 [Dentipellis sp. KUC8613]|nr:hypothetical protein DENSPDRAFT_789689 [Dentipellis sp. KUC8613]